MADVEFEARLDRMFAEAPSYPDGDLFAAEVEARLQRGWTFRRALISGLGLLGGVVGVAQFAGSGAIGHIEALSAGANQAFSDKTHWISTLHLPLPVAPFGGEVVWVAAFIAIVGLGFAITRVIEDL